MAEREGQANTDGAAPPPIAIAFGKTAKDANNRDARRRLLAQLLLNQIRMYPSCHLVPVSDYLLDVTVRSRGDDSSEIKAMSWKWADFAVKHRLRLENWPTPLKATFPSSGFALNSITGKDCTKAMEEMVTNLEARYKGAADDGEGVAIVSWTEGTCSAIS